MLKEASPGIPRKVVIDHTICDRDSESGIGNPMAELVIVSEIVRNSLEPSDLFQDITVQSHCRTQRETDALLQVVCAEHARNEIACDGHGFQYRSDISCRDSPI